MQLSEERRMIRDAVREFAEAELRTAAGRIDAQAAFDPAVLAQLAPLNLFGLMAPAERGGAEVDFETYVLVLEEVARVCGSTALLLLTHNSLGLGALLAHGAPALRERWVGPLARGEALAAFAWTESDAGSDAGALATAADRQGERWALSGTKTAVACAAVAHVFVVAARESEQDIGLFWVEKNAPGVAVSADSDTLGLRAAGLARLELRDVIVDREARLEIDGAASTARLIDSARIGIAAMAAGIARGAFERALRYARERPQFVEAIVEHQSVQLRLADSWAEVEASRLLVREAATAFAAGEAVTRLAATAKLFAADAATRTCDHAVQVHGGYGYVSEYQVERAYRDAKMCEIAYGASDLQRFAIVHELIREAESGWSLLQ
jgi:alkylation response protein AidB-like acyl-CoA dehydrogenase